MLCSGIPSCEVKGKTHMKSRHTQSWQISVDTPYLFLLALYIRDALSLHPQSLPLLPPLIPSIDRVSTVSEPEKAYVTQQWESWWYAIFPLFSGKEQAGYLQTISPPDFSGLAHLPGIRDGMKECFSQATQWINTRKNDHAQTMLHLSDKRLEAEVVHELMNERGISDARFRLDLLLLPCASKNGWLIASNRACLTELLYEDREAYRQWLKSIVIGLL